MEDVLEIYKRYRPQSLKAVKGQPAAVAVVTQWLAKGAVPRAVLVTGPSGTGKTTLGRIIAKEVGCNPADLHEVNCADARGIDDVRAIRSAMSKTPLGGGRKVWILDEVHKATSDAQTMMLKILEDTPRHVHFILCTTDPNKLLKTIHSRCSELRLVAGPAKVLADLVAGVAAKEKLVVSDDVVDRIVQAADGNYRKALVILEQVGAIEGEEEQLAAALSADASLPANALAKLLLNPKPAWAEVAKAIKAIEDEPEAVRRMVLGYMGGVVLGGGKLALRAYLVMNAFRDSYFETGRAGLTMSCWEAVNG